MSSESARRYARMKARRDGAEGTPEQQTHAVAWFAKRAAKKQAKRGLDPKRERQRSRDYYTRNREKLRATTLPIAAAKHKAKLEALAGRERPTRCEVCGCESQDSKAIHWDHDHATGEFRGWLCVRCNHTLGKAKDDPELLWKLAAYLEAPYGPGPLADEP